MSDFIWNMLRRVWQAGAVANDRLFRHGCDFSRWATQEELGFAESAGNQYQPSDGGLKKLLKRFHITPEDAIIDIGCGKGKAMLREEEGTADAEGVKDINLTNNVVEGALR